MKGFRMIILGWICLAVMTNGNATQAKTFRIGTVSDGDASRAGAMLDLIQREIFNMTQGAHTVEFPKDGQVSGNWDLNRVNQALDTLLSSGHIDLVITLGAVSTHEACRRRTLAKPVIGADVIDAQTQELPSDKGVSGVANLNYINTFSNIDRALQSFLDIAPFYRVAVLADAFQLQSIPQLQKLERRLAHEFSLTIRVIPVKTSAASALEQIPENTDAVFVSGLPRLTDREFATLVQGLIRKQLPSFSFAGRTGVEQGLLSGIIPADDRRHTARSVAINVQELLDGNPAETLQTYFPLGGKLSINMATARAIGVYPGWHILTEADLLNEEDRAGAGKMDIRSAVAQARQSNPDLAAAGRAVAAGAEQVRAAKAALFPQLTLGSHARIIDDDRAEAAFGAAPEREWTGSLAASQLLYSDKARANYEIEKFSQSARAQQRDAVALDIVRSAATAYLNVLRAKRIERIQKNNLKLTRKNLERAQIRVSIGAAGPEEVYRWENQIAESRRNVLTSESVTLDTMSSLNRLLNQPLRDPFGIDETEYKAPLSILPDRRILAYMDTPQALNAMRDFLVDEGMAASPELKQIDAAIAAGKRAVVLARREYWQPSVALVGDITRCLSDGGNGTAPPSALAALGSGSGADDTAWTAGITLTLPLYSGGKKSAFLGENAEKLARLQYQKRSTANTIEQRVLSSVYLIRASYPAIRLTMSAADAARKNLTLVTASYARGIKSIIDLIDAQNSALVADQQAANAVYDFLIDLMAVQRSLGNFFVFAPEPDYTSFMDRLDQYMDARGFGRRTP